MPSRVKSFRGSETNPAGERSHVEGPPGVASRNHRAARTATDRTLPLARNDQAHVETPEVALDYRAHGQAIRLSEHLRHDTFDVVVARAVRAVGPTVEDRLHTVLVSESDDVLDPRGRRHTVRFHTSERAAAVAWAVRIAATRRARIQRPDQFPLDASRAIGGPFALRLTCSYQDLHRHPPKSVARVRRSQGTRGRRHAVGCAVVGAIPGDHRAMEEKRADAFCSVQRFPVGERFVSIRAKLLAQDDTKPEWEHPSVAG